MPVQHPLGAPPAEFTAAATAAADRTTACAARSAAVRAALPPPSFRPAWWVPGPHVQTVYGRFAGRPLPVGLRTERWDTPDDDFVDVVRSDGATPEAPRLILLHGLEGGLHSHYARGLFARTRALGWGMDLLLHRSCGPEINRQRRFYHSGETSDAALLVARAAAEYDVAPLVLCGVSLGGNLALKYLGERGALAPGHPDAVPNAVRGAVAISVPYDLARGSRHIGRGVSRVYERHFLRSLTRKVEAKLLAYPDLIADPAALRTARSLWEFDDRMTAPVHGFAGAEDYYARSSGLRFLGGVRVPTLLLSAADDPFLPSAVLDEVRAAAVANPCLTVEFHARGGHVGFVGGARAGRPDYYAERRTAEWAEAAVRVAGPNGALGGEIESN